ncbi:MAG: SUMF1/EgtB/PvdO family nonheme iron enzyme [Thermoguttaceae bacterium]
MKLTLREETIDGPTQGGNRAAWLAEMQQWRDAERNRIKYDPSQYARPELQWTQRTFVQPQMMVEERYLYDPRLGEYTVDRYLDDLETRYGGIDSVLIWPVYPNIGIDNRNQHDLLHDMPGGLDGVKKMVDDFHRHGVRVLFPVMPWDVGTRPEGVPLCQAAARDMKAIAADGINGDTFSGIPVEFRNAAAAVGHPLAFEPECLMQDQALIAWNIMTWGYWDYPPTPVVSKYKWLESRHMVNVCERWAMDRTDGLQAAYFNGVGYESWENVWGVYNQFTPRDAEALRRIATIERAMADMLVSPGWEPHVPTLQPQVFASRFPLKERTLWLIVNRSNKDLSGQQLAVPHVTGVRYYDLWNGARLKAAIAGQTARLSFPIEARGYGAVLAVPTEKTPADVKELLGTMTRISAVPLARYSSQWKMLPQKIVKIAATKPRPAADGFLIPSQFDVTGVEIQGDMDRMQVIHPAKYRFKVSGVEIEGDDAHGVDVQYPWEDRSQKSHDKEIDIKMFLMDRYPVTNGQFKQFLDASRYQPKDDHNFLKDWKNGTYPDGWAKKPVTWVSIGDARAYAAWAGKRLPHEWEWQYAAQGTDGRLHPWGNADNPAAIPKHESGRELRPPTDVDAFPKGASPFGVMDMTGNVWQWSDEYRDEHTRAAVVRGGSYYRPSGSGWYFPENTRLDQHGKYLLIAPSKDRSAMIGFRCAADISK